MAGTCEVALPLPLRNSFTYAVPDALVDAVVAGSRVVVPFRNRTMIGVVLEVSGSGANAATSYRQPLKDVAEALDVQPALWPCLVDLGNWVASYYLAPVGETFRAMLPPAVKLRAPRVQMIVTWNGGADRGTADGEAAAKARGKAEARVQVALTERGPLPLAQLVKIAGVTRKLVERLAQQGKVRNWEEPAALESIFEEEFEAPSNVLNEEQERAFGEIGRWLDAGAFTVGLLHGVTGSGKTEVYLRAVAATLERGQNALILVPEIGLTLQMARLCRARFGDGVAVLHSGLGDQERAREWWRVRNGEARVVVGTRSAVFAPLANVGLVIVDEEQESSYKQEETPRYNGRDVAVVRGKLEGAVVLLGSATPSMESFHHARLGKYKLLRLGARIENRPMAPVEVVDLREDFRQTHRAGPVSERLRPGATEEFCTPL